MSDQNEERRKIIEMELRRLMPHAQSVDFVGLSKFIQKKEIEARINLIAYYEQSGEPVSQVFLAETRQLCDYDLGQLYKVNLGEAP